jgi:hypothetical protein
MRKNLVNIKTLKLFLFCLVMIILLYTVLTRKQTTIKYTKEQSKEGVEDGNSQVEVKSNNIPDKIATEEFGSNIESILKTNTNDFYFVSTLGTHNTNIDGLIHAFGEGNEKLWSVNLGKPLIDSNVNTQSTISENTILPGLDGNIYLYTENAEKPLVVFYYLY